MPWRWSPLAPPIRFAHRGVPEMPGAGQEFVGDGTQYFAMKLSVAPRLVSGPVPKSAVPTNVPPATTLPLRSVATACTRSSHRPPARRAQRVPPLAVGIVVVVAFVVVVEDVVEVEVDVELVVGVLQAGVVALTHGLIADCPVLLT